MLRNFWIGIYLFQSMILYHRSNYNLSGERGGGSILWGVSEIFNILKFFHIKKFSCYVKSINIMVVPTEKYVIDLSGFMQFSIGSLSVINKLN